MASGGPFPGPDAAQRDGAIAPAHLKVTLSNGVVVERKGKNASLTVTDPTGRRSCQQLLNAFVRSRWPSTCPLHGRQRQGKADILLRIIGIGAEHDTRDLEIMGPVRQAPSPASWPNRKSTLPRNWSPARKPRTSRSALPTSSASNRTSLPATARTSASAGRRRS